MRLPGWQPTRSCAETWASPAGDLSRGVTAWLFGDPPLPSCSAEWPGGRMLGAVPVFAQRERNCPLPDSAVAFDWRQVPMSRVVAMSDSHKAATGGRAEPTVKAARSLVRARPPVAALCAVGRRMRRCLHQSAIVILAAPLVAGCAVLSAGPPSLPGRYTSVREQLVIHSDFPLPAEHRLLEDLTARRADLGRELALPLSDEPIQVYLFENPERFNRFMRLYHPEFPERRAFFVETDTRLIVYALWADRVAEDLRHEATHAHLHSVVPQLPLWLDEGLAESFEVPRGHADINRVHLEYLAARLERGGWQPDLARLERFQSSFDMGQDEYAESWAWVHFLLHSRPEYRDLLQAYLGQLRRDGSAEPLRPRLARMLDRPEAALVDHVGQLAASVRVDP
jgi:hypothetical protein